MTKRPSTAVRTASLLSTMALTTTLTVCVTALGTGDSTPAVSAAPATSALGARDVASDPMRPAGRQPNILMVTTDDMSMDDLAYMPRVRKQLVRQGTTLTNGLAPTPLCVPARASLLTGQYTHNHRALGVKGTYGGLRSFQDNRTLPTWLQDAGYDTLFVGKYLNGYGKNGTRRYVPPGWTSWHGSVDPHTYIFKRTVLNNNGTVTRKKQYNTDGFGAKVDQLLSKPRRTTKPWYMWVNYVAPHFGGPREPDDPLKSKKRTRRTPATTSPAPRHRNMFKNKSLPNKPNIFHRDETKHVSKTQWKRSARNRREIREVHQQRLEALQAVDQAVGKHLRVLRRTGQLANTVVVFSSDNGFAVGEHNMLGKFWFYEDSLKVPIVVRGPGVPAGVRNATPVTTVDLPVTFASLAGATPTRAVDGADVMPAIRSRREVERVIPIEGYAPTARTERRIYSGIRYGNEFTYARLGAGGAKEELYDLVKDPYQLRNVARVGKYAETLALMRSLDERYRNCAGASCPQSWAAGRG